METTQEPQFMLKLSILHWAKPGVDGQAFATWFQEEQVPRVIKLIQKHGITHYKLYVTPDSLRQTFQKDLDAMKADLPGWKMDTHDLTAIYYFSNPDSMRGLLSDPDWEAKVLKFEEDWIDASRADVQIGWETVFLEDGKIVNTVTKEYD